MVRSTCRLDNTWTKLFFGNILYSAVSGRFLPPKEDRTAAQIVETRNFTPDTVCWIASCTKLMTTIAVMQCVEKGLLNLDDDVSETHLPEFKDAQVLLKVENDASGSPQPTFTKSHGKVTLRYV
jgi:CubicO group peptidase (beta-lactamase class C family)